MPPIQITDKQYLSKDVTGKTYESEQEIVRKWAWLHPPHRASWISFSPIRSIVFNANSGFVSSISFSYFNTFGAIDSFQYLQIGRIHYS
jgi:hypothetical protein